MPVSPTQPKNQLRSNRPVGSILLTGSGGGGPALPIRRRRPQLRPRDGAGDRIRHLWLGRRGQRLRMRVDSPRQLYGNLPRAETVCSHGRKRRLAIRRLALTVSLAAMLLVLSWQPNAWAKAPWHVTVRGPGLEGEIDLLAAFGAEELGFWFPNEFLNEPLRAEPPHPLGQRFIVTWYAVGGTTSPTGRPVPLVDQVAFYPNELGGSGLLEVLEFSGAWYLGDGSHWYICLPRPRDLLLALRVTGSTAAPRSRLWSRADRSNRLSVRLRSPTPSFRFQTRPDAIDQRRDGPDLARGHVRSSELPVGRNRQCDCCRGRPHPGESPLLGRRETYPGVNERGVHASVLQL